VCAALAPAQVSRVMVDDENRSMDVIVPDDQLSLAIGKKGQNVRLAVQLTRYRIDIKSESYMRQVQADLSEALGAGGAFGDYEAKFLMDNGVASLRELVDSEQELLLAIPGMSEDGVRAVRQRAAELAEERAASEAAQEAAGEGRPARR
jgi:N utilization substance protein A